MFSNIGVLELTIVLVIVLAIFGTKRLRTLGSDLGSAIKGFRSAVSDADKEAEKDAGQLDHKSQPHAPDADFDNTPVEEPAREERK